MAPVPEDLVSKLGSKNNKEIDEWTNQVEEVGLCQLSIQVNLQNLFSSDNSQPKLTCYNPLLCCVRCQPTLFPSSFSLRVRLLGS